MVVTNVIALASLSACVSQIVPLKEHTDSWLGRSIDDYKSMGRRSKTYADQIGWQEKTYQLPNGNTVYVVPVRRDCFIHWETNKAGTMIGYKTEGERCF